MKKDMYINKIERNLDVLDLKAIDKYEIMRVFKSYMNVFYNDKLYCIDSSYIINEIDAKATAVYNNFEKKITLFSMYEPSIRKLEDYIERNINKNISFLNPYDINVKKLYFAIKRNDYNGINYCLTKCTDFKEYYSNLCFLADKLGYKVETKKVNYIDKDVSMAIKEAIKGVE